MKILFKLPLVAAILCALGTFAQDETPNLVKNADFEIADVSTLKKPGMIELCQDWMPANGAASDLFSSGIKSAKVSVPDNDFGSQEALSGERYAGFRAYSKDAKKDRSYLQTTLTKPLVKNKQYCVKFNVSLADLSKYSTNHISAFISRSRIKQTNVGEVLKDAQIMLTGNPVVNEMDGWATICGTYYAKGGETTIVIGSFVRDNEMTIEKVKRPTGMTLPQVYQAYYYVDDVELTMIKAKSECVCGNNKPRQEIIYSKTTPITPEMSLGDVLKASTVYFPSLGSKVNAIGKRGLESAVERLKENPGINISLVAHTDNDEADEARAKSTYVGLGLKRAEAVKAYLVSQGIEEGRIRVSSKDNSDPASTRPTPLSMAQNRRVVIRVS